MRKAIFILFSLLLVVSIVAIPADTVNARPASLLQLSPPSPAQQEDEEAIIKRMLGQLDEARDILEELKQAEHLTEDMDIRDQIDAIIEKVKNIEGLIKAGQNEAALEEKRALSKELEVLAMGYGPGETEAMTRADLDKLTKARDELIAASEKIGNLGPEEALTKDMVDEVRDILKELGFVDDLGSDDSPGVVTTEGAVISPTGPEVGEPVEAEVGKITVQNAIGEALFFLNLAISAAETKLELHRVNRQLVLAFHTLQELIAAELAPAEEEEKPIELEVMPPEVEPVGPLPGIPGAVPPEEEPEGEKGEVEKAVDENIEILERLRQEAEVKAGEKDKSDEEAQKSQEAFEKLDRWMETVVRREVVEEEPAEPVETEMVPLELVGPRPIEIHVETPPSEEPLTPIEVPTSSRIDVSMFRAITENTEAEVKITAPIIDETSETEWEIVIEVIGSEITLIDEGAEAATTLPLVIEENRLYAGEDEDLYPISLLPGDIVNGLEIAPEEISLEPDENQNPVYKVYLEEEAKFLFVPLELTREAKIDPASGEVLSVEQPWWSFSVSKQDIPEIFYQFKEAPQCLCEYIEVKLKKGPEKPTTKLVKRTEKPEDVKVDNTHVNVYIEYYETTITLYLTVTLKCCSEPKDEVCTAKVTVTKPEVSSWDAGSIPAFAKWVPRMKATSSKTTTYATKTRKAKKPREARKKGDEIKQPLQVKWECGKGPYSKEKEQFQVKGVIYSQRYLTPPEYDKEKELESDERIQNMMDDTNASVDFRLNVTCEGWKKEKTAAYDKQGDEITQSLLLTVKLKPSEKAGKPWKVEVVDKAKTKTEKGEENDAESVLQKGVKFREKEPCKQRALIHPEGKR